MVSVAECFVFAGVGLFGAGFLLMLCCHVEGDFDDATDVGGRVFALVSLVLMFSGVVCVVVPVVLGRAGLL